MSVLLVPRQPESSAPGAGEPVPPTERVGPGAFSLSLPKAPKSRQCAPSCGERWRKEPRTEVGVPPTTR